MLCVSSLQDRYLSCFLRGVSDGRLGYTLSTFIDLEDECFIVKRTYRY